MILLFLYLLQKNRGSEGGEEGVRGREDLVYKSLIFPSRKFLPKDENKANTTKELFTDEENFSEIILISHLSIRRT